MLPSAKAAAPPEELNILCAGELAAELDSRTSLVIDAIVSPMCRLSVWLEFADWARRRSVEHIGVKFSIF